jgi:hypothetical protein
VSALRNLAALALLLFVTRGGAASDTYWVFLDPAFASSALPAAVSAHTLATRAPLPTDVPIQPRAVAAVEATGARVLYRSRWLRALAVEADRRELRRIARLAGVRGVRRARAGFVAAAATPNAAQDSAFYGPTWYALRDLNIPLLHEEFEFTGAGVRIGLVDTGFYLLHETLEDVFVGAQRDFINNDNNVSPEANDAVNQARHGTHVLSLLAGFQPGEFVGGAYAAQLFLAKVKRVGQDSVADEVRWVAGVEWLDSIGVSIINSSIGFKDDFADRPPIQWGELDGNTDITTRMADEAARRGILMVIAIGNDGPASGTLWAPSDADSVIAVGSVDSLVGGRSAVPTNISSRGPTGDQRLKPELSARAGRVTAASVLSPGAYESGLTGSSYAAPLISAGAALFIQAWDIYARNPMGVREALILAGSDFRRPDVARGYGVPDIAGAIMMPAGITPAGVSSTDLQGNLTTIVPTFRWTVPLVHPRMTPITYRVDVAMDSQFGQILYSDTTIEASSHTARAPLRPQVQPVYWRIMATSPQGVRRVSTTGTLRVPEWVTLLTLAEPRVVFIDELRPTLSWLPLQAPAPIGPFTFDVQILSATNQVVQQVRNLNTTTIRVPEPLTPNQSFRWRVIARTSTGVADTVTSPQPFVVESTDNPPATLLYRPFPNPFPNLTVGALSTHVWFDLSQRGPVDLAVYDSRGRLVRRLIPAQPECGTVTLEAGLYGRAGQTFDVPSVGGQPCAVSEWDGRDMRGERVPRGVYIIRLRARGADAAYPVLFMPS